MQNRKLCMEIPRVSISLKASMWFYLMFLPVFIFGVVFYYLPMFGIVYSFTEYKLIKDPVWTGFKNFETLFSKPMFWRAFKNTLFLSISKLLLNTFAAVVVSLL